MLRKFLIAATALVCLLAAGCYLSPYWTLHRMQSAIEARDYDAFSLHVDYPALRNSFKEQLVAAGRAPDTPDEDNDNPLGALGQSVVDTLVGPMLSAVVTPAGVIEMMNTGRPEITQAVVASAITRVPTATGPLPAMTIAYQGWDRVIFHRADSRTEQGSFVLVRSGWWGWKLAAVELRSPAH
jgi:hypothetical protein